MNPSRGPLEAALQLHRVGNFEAAEASYARILEEDPHAASAWHLRGVLAGQQGRGEDSRSYLLRAVELAPQIAVYHFNLALAYKSLGQLPEAAQSYRQALALKPDNQDAAVNLGNVLMEMGEAEQAAEQFREVATRDPQCVWAHHNLGNALQQLGEYLEAEQAYRRALSIDPRFADAYYNLGQLLNRLGGHAEAAEVWQQWLASDPEHPTARHMAAATTGQQVPQRADDQHVRNTFDANFASEFDGQLARLQYRAPELIEQTVKSLIPKSQGQLTILDAGCGTGLCGVRLRPWARHLTGVDLSPDMLRRARERQVYDVLIEQELTALLQDSPGQYDLIISSDTFNYFGNLLPLLAAAARAVAPQGLLVFTLEQMLDAGPGAEYRLQPHGRYCHAREYVQQVLASAGWQQLALDQEQLRVESGQPVVGLLVSARATAS